VTYLLDTCCVSELIRPNPDSGLISWFENTDESVMHLCVLTVGELEKGIAKLTASARRGRLEAWVRNDLAERFRGRVISIDEAVASKWGKLVGEAERSGSPLPVIDSLLAATALSHQLMVVTRNLGDFERCGARCLNPWTS
jgi:toxin FitB